MPIGDVKCPRQSTAPESAGGGDRLRAPGGVAGGQFSPGPGGPITLNPNVCPPAPPVGFQTVHRWARCCAGIGGWPAGPGPIVTREDGRPEGAGPRSENYVND